MALKVNIKKDGSPKYSFKNWDILKFIVGRKKTLVTLVGAGLGYLLTNQADIAFYSAGIVESVFAIVEYYIKKK